MDTGLAVGRAGCRGCVVKAAEGWKQAVIGHPGGDANLEASWLPPGGVAQRLSEDFPSPP